MAHTTVVASHDTLTTAVCRTELARRSLGPMQPGESFCLTPPITRVYRNMHVIAPALHVCCDF